MRSRAALSDVSRSWYLLGILVSIVLFGLLFCSLLFLGQSRLTRTRSATAGEGERGLEWRCIPRVKRGRTPASGWLHRLVRRLHLVMHALQISSTWRWSVPQHPPYTFSCFSLLKSSLCWRPN